MVKKTTTTNLKTKKTVVTRKIVAATVPVYPDHTDRSVFINRQALPILIQETLQAQSTSDRPGVGRDRHERRVRAVAPVRDPRGARPRRRGRLLDRRPVSPGSSRSWGCRSSSTRATSATRPHSSRCSTGSASSTSVQHLQAGERDQPPEPRRARGSSMLHPRRARGARPVRRAARRDERLLRRARAHAATSSTRRASSRAGRSTGPRRSRDGLGWQNYAINAGGDIRVRGCAAARTALAGRDPASARDRPRSPAVVGGERPRDRDLGRVRAREARRRTRTPASRRPACSR